VGPCFVEYVTLEEWSCWVYGAEGCTELNQLVGMVIALLCRTTDNLAIARHPSARPYKYRLADFASLTKVYAIAWMLLTNIPREMRDKTLIAINREIGSELCYLR
jgi:hypothetical protein